jgi:phage-related protein
VDVRATFGFDLWLVQRGEVPSSSKTLRGFGSADVRELIDDDEAGTYRAVYTVRFQDAVYILHAFQKKSKTGIATDRQTIDLIRQRLKEAEGRHRSQTAEPKEKGP